ncbi:MAG: molybdenum cofactor guanylyltransferase [Mucilaginibacter sp.]|uniref:molybdenum cofactor guanylyltransferase n=1 Tax=Mucilaginibacter sp. TaxID=1882438 RepID=UPI0032663BD8
MEKLLGVVMCGGQSQRMGTDKGLIKQGDATWAQLIFNKLKQFNIPVVVSINPTQTATYSSIFNATDLVTDAMDIPGPLNGILSVHASYPNNDLLILACDMIDMDYPTLKQLVDIQTTDSGYNYYAYNNGEFFEPLCALYTARGLNTISQTGLSNYSLQTVLNNGNTKRLEITNAKAFKNQNNRE